MVRAVAQIEQEIAALDQTVSAIAQAFYDAYQQYLTALGKAMRQQFVLAGYHICTHAYPEQFLSIALEQRQSLQQSLQQLAKQGQIELLDCLTPVQIAFAQTEASSEIDDSADESSDQEEQPEELTDFASSEQAQLELSQSESSFDAEFSENPELIIELDAPTPELTEPSLDQPALELDMPVASPDAGSALLLSEPAQTSSASLAVSSHPSANRLLHPKDIAYWQNHLEEAIAEVLQNLSHTTNCVLQQANILPSQLPEPILEVATKADLSSEAVASPPNLLNLLIEADGEDEKLSMTQVMAMRLRLSEIEFGDAATAAHRSKLRHLTTQLGKLGREYQRKQKERAVAQAEAAWHSSWSE